jgi:carboxypeptidase PM20D1
MKRFIGFIVLVALVLLSVAAVRALLLRPPAIASASVTPIPLDNAGAIQRFVGAIQIPTESRSEQPPDLAVMARMHDYLQQSFPRVHATMQREVLPDGALIYTWQGRDPTAKPVILMGHFDVVPAAAETLSQWKHPPYSGDQAEGFIWGRGTIDDKIHVLSLLEAAETLITRGFTPSRTILLCFGDDEENGGDYGAVNIVRLLKQRGVQPEFVIDEGGMVVNGAVPGLTHPLALIGTAEKGMLNLEITTKGQGGHSSAPPPHTAIGQLSTALAKLEAHQFPTSMPSVQRDQYTLLAPYLPFSQKLILGNLWLFKPLILYTGIRNQERAGNFRTTTAEDMISGGFKDNALPTSARAVVNFRLLPGDTVASAIDHVRKVIADPGVSIVDMTKGAPRNPSPISPLDSAGYRTLATTIHQFFPDTVVVPNLLNAGTDSTYYTALTPNVYRFLAVDLDLSALTMAHGINERVAPEKYLKTVQFTTQLIQNIP